MNACDLEETKHMALEKFKALTVDPEFEYGHWLDGYSVGRFNLEGWETKDCLCVNLSLKHIKICRHFECASCLGMDQGAWESSWSMNPSLLSLSIAQSLYIAEPMQDRYVEFLISQFHFHGLPKEKPMAELGEGEAEIVYCRDSPVSERCGCGVIGAKPVMIGDRIMAYHCENCWTQVVEGANQRRAEYERMIAEGVHPKIASRKMLARK